MHSTSMPTGLSHLWSRFNQRPALLLVLTTLIWGSNAVAARLAVGHVSPMMLTTARWAIACLALWLVARHQVMAYAPVLRPRWRYLVLMGTCGFTAFNALFYAAAHHTTAVNLALIQGVIPVLVLLGGQLLVQGHKLGVFQLDMRFEELVKSRVARLGTRLVLFQQGLLVLQKQLVHLLVFGQDAGGGGSHIWGACHRGSS